MAEFIYKPGTPVVEPSEALKKGKEIYKRMHEKWWGVSEPITITGTNEPGVHKDGSKHYDIPLDANDFRFPMQFRNWLTELRTELGRDFDVVIEGTHVHLEFDKKDD